MLWQKCIQIDICIYISLRMIISSNWDIAALCYLVRGMPSKVLVKKTEVQKLRTDISSWHILVHNWWSITITSVNDHATSFKRSCILARYNVLRKTYACMDIFHTYCFKVELKDKQRYWYDNFEYRWYDNLNIIPSFWGSRTVKYRHFNCSSDDSRKHIHGIRLTWHAISLFRKKLSSSSRN